MTTAPDLVAEAIATATKLDDVLDRLWDEMPALDSRPGLNLDCRAFLKAAKALEAELDGMQAEKAA